MKQQTESDSSQEIEQIPPQRSSAGSVHFYNIYEKQNAGWCPLYKATRATIYLTNLYQDRQRSEKKIFEALVSQAPNQQAKQRLQFLLENQTQKIYGSELKKMFPKAMIYQDYQKILRPLRSWLCTNPRYLRKVFEAKGLKDIVEEFDQLSFYLNELRRVLKIRENFYIEHLKEGINNTDELNNISMLPRKGLYKETHEQFLGKNQINNVIDLHCYNMRKAIKFLRRIQSEVTDCPLILFILGNGYVLGPALIEEFGECCFQFRKNNTAICLFDIYADE